MKLTPEARRNRIHEIVKADPEYQKMDKEYQRAYKWFVKFTSYLPKMLSSRLWETYGMFCFMHHRMLTRICEQMRFEDEE